MKIIKLLAQAMGQVGAVAKTRQNTQQGYSFRGIDDIYLAVQPVFSELGIVMVPQIMEYQREERTTKSGGTLMYTILKVGFGFYADDNTSVTVVTMGEAMDSGDKSCNKAMSSACKYALMQLLCIPTAEPKDTESFEHEAVKPKYTSYESTIQPPKTIPLSTQGDLSTALSWCPKTIKADDIAALNSIKKFNGYEIDTKGFSGKPIDLYCQFVSAACTNNSGEVLIPNTQKFIDDMRKQLGEGKTLKDFAQEVIKELSGISEDEIPF